VRHEVKGGKESQIFYVPSLEMAYRLVSWLESLPERVGLNAEKIIRRFLESKGKAWIQAAI
jgi:hypothetical protein